MDQNFCYVLYVLTAKLHSKMSLQMKTVGQTDEQLKAAIDLIYTMMVYNKDICAWGIDTENGVDRLCFDLSTGDICKNKLPVVHNESMIFEVCKTWLKNYKKVEGGGDGSYSKGWVVELGDWTDHYEFAVSGTTLYFGK